MAKAEPICNSGSKVSDKRCTKKKVTAQKYQEKRELGLMRETTLQTENLVKKEGKEVLQVPEQRFSWKEIHPEKAWTV